MSQSHPMSRTRSVRRMAVAFSVLLAGSFIVTATAAPPAGAIPASEGQLIISEFRLRGPNGSKDEFIEIYNASGADHTVVAASGTGYGVAASDGTTRCSIPNGTVFPNRGHYLCGNSVGYSLASYPAGNGTTATLDGTYTQDIPDNAGIAIFNNNVGGASYSLANRLDAVGSTSEANTNYKEGTGYPALTPFSIDYSFYRDYTNGGSITTLEPVHANSPLPKDTDNNASDFVFVDTNGTSAGAGQRLGAPGPENTSSPLAVGLPVSLLDPCVDENSAPNAVRDLTSDPPNNSTFGTLDIRRTITNNTGGNVTRLRLRVADVRTFPAPSDIADMRSRTSPDVVTTVDRAPCGAGTSNITVHGTTLEQPPSQPNGGGFNSSLSVGVVTLATPLANGASVDIRLLLGIQQTGDNAVRVIAEALPGGSAPTAAECWGGWIGNGQDNMCNVLPVAADDNAAIAEDAVLDFAAPGLLANDTGSDGDPLTAEKVTDPAHGSVVVDPDGGFTYTPDVNYHGPDSFTYKAKDGSADSAPATVSLTVTPMNDVPVAANDVFATNEGTPITTALPGVLENDTDADGDPLTAQKEDNPSHGSVTFNANGTFTYTPEPGFHGADSFTYTANDASTSSNAATVTINVADVNDSPDPVDPPSGDGGTNPVDPHGVDGGEETPTGDHSAPVDPEVTDAGNDKSGNTDHVIPGDRDATDETSAPAGPGQLPRTGSTVVGPLAAGLALILGGGTIRGVARRRARR